MYVFSQTGVCSPKHMFRPITPMFRLSIWLSLFSKPCGMFWGEEKKANLGGIRIGVIETVFLPNPFSTCLCGVLVHSVLESGEFLQCVSLGLPFSHIVDAVADITNLFLKTRRRSRTLAPTTASTSK